jgi:ABC-type transporter Mla maintaining outer membrane lipid asymmetry ATPase subunit MlaF
VHLVESLLVDVNQRLGVTMVIASHHIASTFRMAGQIVLLVGGGAVCGPMQSFRSHEDPRVEEFFAGDQP